MADFMQFASKDGRTVFINQNCGADMRKVVEIGQVKEDAE